MTANRLEMNNINLAFSGFRALSNVAFTLRGGSVHALTGANGAGKSTLMAVLCGTHAHYEGEIVINNQPVSVRSPRDAKQLGIHLVQQEVDVALVPGLSIAENIMLDRLAEPGLGFSWRAVREQAREALAQAGYYARCASPHRQLYPGGETADSAGPRAVAPLPVFDSG
ncbi:Xylose import ATP-binding protein XylG [Raoultella planticola]|uniref:Xylose import ATP-binding protein XylG n=1 Tax=Raoultella planticola TaxID=575 RepID=A0A485CPK9_RAOPL|nr:Xylose import ATP-binding protein XylG [Raoultella planticola]